MPTVADLENAWASVPLVKIRRSTPEGALKSLKRHQAEAHIDFSSGNGFLSRYLTDKVAIHRRALEMIMYMEAAPYDPDNYCTYEGVTYDCDLSMVHGVWKEPFKFTFNNLTVLNLDLSTALYWAIPIIKSTSSDALRRLIIQRIDDLHMMAFPFPYTELDHCLFRHPLLKVIFVYCGPECIPIFRRHLPLLDLREKLKFIEEPAMDPNLDSDDLAMSVDVPTAYTFRPEEDPYGEGSMFEEIVGYGKSEQNPIVVE